jgi:trigger factor
MVRLELDSRWRSLARRYNTDSDGLYRLIGSSPEKVESIMEGWKPDVERALHSRLIVETLMDDLKLEASDEEVEGEIEKIARESDAELDEVKQYYEANHMKEYVKQDIKERKVFEILLEKNIIKPGKTESYVDLITNNE